MINFLFFSCGLLALSIAITIILAVLDEIMVKIKYNKEIKEHYRNKDG